jgi:rubrerythrin
MAHANTAVPESGAIEVRGFTRGAFILRGALAVGAVYGAGTIGPFVKQAVAQDAESSGDVEILNFALTLEYVEAEFYRQALELDLSSGVMALAQTLGTHERDHIAALKETIDVVGGTPTDEPQVSFPIRDERSFLELAQTLEETGVSAYNGAAPSIESREVLAAAGQIVQIEARHAADIRTARAEPPAPNAFDDSLEMAQVLEAVQPFIKP